MKTLKIATLAVVSTALSLGLAQAQERVRLGTEGAYPPYNFINDNGEVDGFEREVGDALCEIAQLDCVWVTNEWDSIIPNLLSGNYDAIIAGMSVTAERQEVINFSETYFPPDPSAYIALSGAADEVTSGIVAAQTATIQAAHVVSSGATLVEFSTPDEATGALRSGQADAVLADKAFLMPIIDADSSFAFVGEDVVIGGGIGLGMRKSDTDLKERFDAAIKQMKDDGSLNALIQKWFEGVAGF